MTMVVFCQAPLPGKHFNFSQLNDKTSFKQQVLSYEKTFIHMFMKDLLKEICVKAQIPWACCLVKLNLIPIVVP